MKNNYNMKQYQLFILCSKKIEHLPSGILILLLIVLLPFSGHAQFITLKLDIPAKTGQTEIVPFEMHSTTNTNTGQQTLNGTTVICISGAENFFVQAFLSHSDSLRNELGQAIPFTVSLAYRNDGNSKPPGTDANHQASFPLSNSRRIIENMKNSSQVLDAFIFIHAGAALPKVPTSTYVGFINFKIEYN